MEKGADLRRTRVFLEKSSIFSPVGGTVLPPHFFPWVYRIFFSGFFKNCMAEELKAENKSSATELAAVSVLRALSAVLFRGQSRRSVTGPRKSYRKPWVPYSQYKKRYKKKFYKKKGYKKRYKKRR